MKIDVEMRPSFWIRGSIELVDALLFLSKTHYDFHCQSYSADDGFLPRWRRLVAVYGENESRMEASWHDFDTLLKVCEMGSFYPPSALSPAGQVKISEFVVSVRRAMDVGRRMMVSKEVE